MSEKFLFGRGESASGKRGLDVRDQMEKNWREDLLDSASAHVAQGVLADEYEGRHKAGRVLEKRPNEIVFPATDKEQKDRLVKSLAEFGIYPWEENQLLIIDNKNDLETLHVLGIGVSRTPETLLTTPDPADHFYSFPYPRVVGEKKPVAEKVAPTEKPEQPERVVAGSMSDEEACAEEYESVETVEEISRHIGEFYAGRVSGEEKAFQKYVGDIPSLALFPHKYVWKSGKVTRARDGVEVTSEEWHKMIKKAQGGDARAKQELIYMNIGLVLLSLKSVRSRAPDTVSSDDLFQEGLIGLAGAIDTHEPERAAFGTHALIEIQSKMRRFERENRYPIRTPTSIYPTRKILIKNTDKTLLGPDGVRGRAVTPLQLEKIRRMFFVSTVFAPIDTLPERAVDEGMNVATAEDMFSPARQLTAQEEQQLSANLTKVLSTLKPRIERMVRMRYGLNSEEREYTLEEIGDFFGCSRQCVKGLLNRALRQIRRPSRSRFIRSFAE